MGGATAATRTYARASQKRPEDPSTWAGSPGSKHGRTRARSSRFSAVRTVAGARPPPARKLGGEPRREPRIEDAGREQRRPQGKGPDQRGGRPRQGAHGQAGPKAKNPYDLPMEERMRLYREKYGHSLDEQGQGGNGRGPSQGEPRPRQGQQAPRQGRGGAQGRGPRPSPKTPAQKQAEPKPSDPAPPSAPVRNESLEQAQRSEGMVSKLLGAFKKKKD